MFVEYTQVELGSACSVWMTSKNLFMSIQRGQCSCQTTKTLDLASKCPKPRSDWATRVVQSMSEWVLWVNGQSHTRNKGFPLELCTLAMIDLICQWLKKLIYVTCFNLGSCMFLHWCHLNPNLKQAFIPCNSFSHSLMHIPHTGS